MSKEKMNALSGKYFHAVKPDRQTITWLGQILGLVSPGVYQVQLLDDQWFRDYQQRLVAASDMRFWILFDTEEEMKAAYLEYVRKSWKTDAQEASGRAGA